MTPAGKHGDQVFCNSPSDQEHLEYFVSEDRPQLFHLQGRSDPEHALPVEASVRHQDMAVGIESEEVAKGLDGDDGACRRSQALRTAPLQSELTRRFRVIHPFHPLCSHEYEVLEFRRDWGRDYGDQILGSDLNIDI